MRVALPFLVVTALSSMLACSSEPKTDAVAPPVSATQPAAPSAGSGSTVTYFHGEGDVRTGALTITMRSPTGDLAPQSLSYGVGAEQVYFHTCGATTYNAATHVLSGTVQAVNAITGGIKSLTAVIDAVAPSGVTPASGTIASYGDVGTTSADCSGSTQTWSFNVPTGGNFSFNGHADGVAGLPVTAGLVAAYDARALSSITKNGSNVVSAWADLSGNGRTLSPNSAPTYVAGAQVGTQPGIDFSGGKGMTSAPFPLTTSVTVFAVIKWGSPGLWGLVATHGSRDDDWSLEENGIGGLNPGRTHFQTSNDNGNVELTLANGTSYILTGRLSGNDRYYGATSSTGTVTASVTAGNSSSAGSKVLWVGKSDNNEPFNGVYGALYYYNRALSDTERDQMVAYLKSAFGI